jgi:hypothetical protein
MFILILVSAITVPAAADDLPSEMSITLTVISPEQYDPIWSDVVPPHG